jgi:hypothetical protein
MSDKRDVKALYNVSASGKHLAAGETHSVSNRDADFLCKIGRCEEVIQKAKKKGPMTTKTAGATIA